MKYFNIRGRTLILVSWVHLCDFGMGEKKAEHCDNIGNCFYLFSFRDHKVLLCKSFRAGKWHHTPHTHFQIDVYRLAQCLVFYQSFHHHRKEKFSVKWFWWVSLSKAAKHLQMEHCNSIEGALWTHQRNSFQMSWVYHATFIEK